MKKVWIRVAAVAFIAIVLIVLINVLRDDAYPFRQERRNVVSIDIVSVEGLSHLTTGYYEGAAKSVYTIDEDEWDAFFDGVDSLKVKSASYPPQENLSGQLLRVTYEDGAFEIIGPYMYYYRNAQGHWSYGYHTIDKEDFQELIHNLKSEHEIAEPYSSP